MCSIFCCERSGKFTIDKLAVISKPADAHESEKVERRPGVVPLPVIYDEHAADALQKHPKTTEDEEIIGQAIERSDFLNAILKDGLLKDVVDAMYRRDVTQDELLIEEGEKGVHMFVSAKGCFEVTVKSKGVVNKFEDVRIFGELAILYNVKRNASVKATTSGRVWVLDRSDYQKLMVRFNIEHQNETLKFLENVPTLNKVGGVVLQKVVSLLKVKYFAPETVIVRQGEKGDKFYIIRAGSVTITKDGEGVVGRLGKGEYFGELALLGDDDIRKATVVADAPGGVECLTLKRQHFIDHFGELRDDGLITVQIQDPKLSTVVKEYEDLKLDDLSIVTTLGIGGFGRVELVKDHCSNLVFALKYLKKSDMVEQNQQEHVTNERHLQMSCRSKFLVRLYRSYTSPKYVYFLMEACLGGDLWTLLQRRKSHRFNEDNARFVTGCVLEAFTYLHERGIVYRDLKPENLLVDERGYFKLTDFGFAKQLPTSGRTFTFAGTPEYIAPEIILNRGHDKAVDYWTLGIFIYELLAGETPFRSTSHMKTYNKILKGVEHVAFPLYFSQKAKHIVQKLCRAIPTQRLGCQRNGAKDVKEHAWFDGFDWVRLNQGKLTPPFTPKLKSNMDTTHFEKFKRDNDVPPDETSGWDKDFD